MLDPAQGFNPAHPNISTLLRLVFAWAFVWSVGANVDDATRPRLEKWVGDNFRGLVGSGSPFLKVCPHMLRSGYAHFGRRIPDYSNGAPRLSN